ncbi:hypothetical protein ES703_96388 [subsurface metagenome]
MLSEGRGRRVKGEGLVNNLYTEHLEMGVVSKAIVAIIGRQNVGKFTGDDP